MKYSLFTLFLCFFSVLCAEPGNYMSLDEARTVAEKYYGSFREIANNPNGDVAIIGQMRIQDIIGKDRNGHEIYKVFILPNDIELLGGKEEKNTHNITITNYINLFRKFAERQKSKFTFNYHIANVDYPASPNLYKGDRDPQFARVVIRKSFAIASLKGVEITDTMILDTHLRCITRISNKFRDATVPVDDVAELMALADVKYSEKKYDEAFAIYERVLTIEPSHGDALYSLGAMLWRGRGCKHKYSVAERKRLYTAYFKRLGVLGERALNYINDGRIKK